MEFIFVFAIVLIKVFLLHFFKVVETVRTLWIDTFMYAEKPAVFLCGKGIATVRTDKTEGCRNDFTGREGPATDFALELAVTAVIVVNEVMWSTA